jgi:hypothetical protein
MTVKEIELAVSGLSQSDLEEFAVWFEEYQARLWDCQIERDVRTGKLDALIRKAEEDFASGRCQPL